MLQGVFRLFVIVLFRHVYFVCYIDFKYLKQIHVWYDLIRRVGWPFSEKSLTIYSEVLSQITGTVKPFNLAALKVGDFHFGKLKPYNLKHCSNFVLFSGLQLIFAPFNFTVLFCSRNSQNKGHASIKGFTV